MSQFPYSAITIIKMEKIRNDLRTNNKTNFKKLTLNQAEKLNLLASQFPFHTNLYVVIHYIYIIPNYIEGIFCIGKI
jgi:hypothetical protein